MKMPQQLIVISAPSGAGKTTVCKRLMARNNKLQMSVSATTRPPRPTEKNGVDYIFLSQDEFKLKVNGNEFLEHEIVHGYNYGTLKSEVEKLLGQGFDVIFDIDVNGALTIKRKYQDAILIFLKPPSLDELKDRLKRRKSDNPGEIEKRLTRLPQEYEKSELFDYIVINDDLSKTVEIVEQILIENKKESQDVSNQNF
jgi:guanylate kinase